MPLWWTEWNNPTLRGYTSGWLKIAILDFYSLHFRYNKSNFLTLIINFKNVCNNAFLHVEFNFVVNQIFFFYFYQKQLFYL